MAAIIDFNGSGRLWRVNDLYQGGGGTLTLTLTLTLNYTLCEKEEANIMC